MITLRQAVELTLSAIEEGVSFDHLDNVTAPMLRRALAEPNKCTHGVTDGNCKECYMAEPDQEPVAWMWRDGTVTSDPDRADGTWTPLYTTPPQRKPLTDEEIGKAWSVADGEHNASAAVKRRITRAIEQAHGIKGEA